MRRINLYLWAGAQGVSLAIAAFWSIFIAFNCVDGWLGISWPVFGALGFILAIGLALGVGIFALTPTDVGPGRDDMTSAAVRGRRMTAWACGLFLLTNLAMPFQVTQTANGPTAHGLSWITILWLIQVPIPALATFFTKCPGCAKRALSLRRSESSVGCRCRKCGLSSVA